MMMVFASGQSARGSFRRSALAASQAMSPWRPSARKLSSAAPAPWGGSALAKRTASKPSAFAACAIRSLSGAALAAFTSEVEVGIAPGGDEARDAVGEQRPERGPGLEQRIPVLGRIEILPGHFA